MAQYCFLEQTGSSSAPALFGRTVPSQVASLNLVSHFCFSCFGSFQARAPICTSQGAPSLKSSHHWLPVCSSALGPGQGGLILPVTIYKKPGAFLALTLACIEVVCIIAAGAVLYSVLRRDRPPDTRIECSIRFKSMR